LTSTGAASVPMEHMTLDSSAYKKETEYIISSSLQSWKQNVTQLAVCNG